MKKVLFVFAIVISAASAQASYLRWQLADTITMQNTGASYDFNGGINYAQVHVLNNGVDTGVAEVGEIVNGQYSSLGTDGKVTSAGEYVVNIGDIAEESQSAYSFYVEYIGFDANYGETMVGAGTEATYTELANSIVGYNSEGLVPIEYASIWLGGTANAPEPTSAMLMLLGVAGLALKRKQRKAE